MSDYEMILKMFERVNETNYSECVDNENLVIEIYQSDEYYNTYLIFDSDGNFKEIG